MEISGVSLAVVGMSVVFLALALLALTAWILERVFRREHVRDTETKAMTGTSEVEAVIALALAYHTGKKGLVHIHSVDESGWMQQTRVYT